MGIGYSRNCIPYCRDMKFAALCGIGTHFSARRGETADAASIWTGHKILVFLLPNRKK
jgi:hypothetical protein